MTRLPPNPYAHPDPIEPTPGATRTSSLAVSSLVASLLCCLPGLGVVGTFLGVGALVGISSSQGRVTGRGLAFAGIILGLLSTMLWIGGAMGVRWGLGEMDMYGRAVQAMQQGKHDEARAALEPRGGAPVDDAAMDAFAAAVTAEWGQIHGLPSGLGRWFTAYGEINGGESALQLAEQVYNEPIPLPLKFDGGITTMIVVMGDTPGPSGFFPRLQDVGVQARDGSIIWLHGSPPGP